MQREVAGRIRVRDRAHHNFQDLHEGDLLETYETRQVERELSV